MHLPRERVELIDDLPARLFRRQTEVVARDVERKLLALDKVLILGVIGCACGPIEPPLTRFVDADFVASRLQLRSVETKSRLNRVQSISCGKPPRGYLLSVHEQVRLEIGLEFMAGLEIFG